jgi:hypothetical protein
MGLSVMAGATGAELGPQTPPAQVPPLRPSPFRQVISNAAPMKIQNGAFEGLSAMMRFLSKPAGMNPGVSFFSLPSNYVPCSQPVM